MGVGVSIGFYAVELGDHLICWESLGVRVPPLLGILFFQVKPTKESSFDHFSLIKSQ